MKQIIIIQWVQLINSKKNDWMIIVACGWVWVIRVGFEWFNESLSDWVEWLASVWVIGKSINEWYCNDEKMGFDLLSTKKTDRTSFNKTHDSKFLYKKRVIDH